MCLLGIYLLIPSVNLHDPSPDSNAGGSPQPNSLLCLIHELVFPLPVEGTHLKQEPNHRIPPLIPVTGPPCLSSPDSETPEPIIIVTLSEDVVDISGQHLTHDLLKKVSVQTTREQQKDTCFDWLQIPLIGIDLTPRMALIVAMGDFSPIVGSDLHSTRTNRVINSGHIADRHQDEVLVIGEMVEGLMGIDCILDLLICFPTIPWSLPLDQTFFSSSRVHSIPHHCPHPRNIAHTSPSLLMTSSAAQLSQPQHPGLNF